MTKTLIDPARVIDIAYSNTEYTPQQMVSTHDIVAAERNYLIPVIGESLYNAIAEGDYPMLLSDFVAPVVALYTREVANAPTAPSSKEGMRRARSMMLYLSDYLDDHHPDYPEYSPTCNILKRCRINGTHIQIH